MNAEEKQALIEFCNVVVSDIKCDSVAHDDPVVMDTLRVFEIALAALTAQPVKWPAFPHSTQEIDLALGYRDRDWVESIRAAGYEVQE